MKQFFRLSSVILAILLLCGCTAPANSTAGTTPSSPAAEADALFGALFDLNNKISISIDMSDAELQKMQDDYVRYAAMGSQSPIYRMANVTITIGEDTYYIEEVGVRMKGNTSRTSFYNAEDGIYNAIHLKLNFQETFDDEAYYGADAKKWTDAARKERKNRTFATLEKLDLRWNRCDDGSYLKEYYAYEIYRDFGVLAPHVNLASLNWSGVHMGVYTINEPVDKVFLEKNLPAEALGGDLYKCGWAGWQNASFANTNSIGVEDPDKCQFYAYDLKTNKKTSDHAALEHIIASLNDGSVTEAEFAELVDVAYFLSYAAVSYLLGNPDDLRNNYNNTYLYFRPDTGQMLLIPYDYDRCLGVTAHWNPTHTGVTDDDPFTDELQSADRNDPNANRYQQSPLFLYSVCAGGHYVKEYATVLETVAKSHWFGQDTFPALFAIAKAHYADEATPDRRLRNTQDLYMAFDLERTSDFSSNGNISFREYVDAKLATLERCLGDLDKYLEPIQRPEYYIRADFTDWQKDDQYLMTPSDGCYTMELKATQEVRLKVYHDKSGRWYGTECVAEDCTVKFDTDSHTNIVLQPGSYRITFDPVAQTITLEQLA